MSCIAVPPSPVTADATWAPGIKETATPAKSTNAPLISHFSPSDKSSLNDFQNPLFLSIVCVCVIPVGAPSDVATFVTVLLP